MATLSEMFPQCALVTVEDKSRGSSFTWTAREAGVAVNGHGYPLPFADDEVVISRWRCDDGSLFVAQADAESPTGWEPTKTKIAEGELSLLLTNTTLRGAFTRGHSPRADQLAGGWSDSHRPGSKVLAFAWPLSRIDRLEGVPSNAKAKNLYVDANEPSARLIVNHAATVPKPNWMTKGLGMKNVVVDLRTDLESAVTAVRTSVVARDASSVVFAAPRVPEAGVAAPAPKPVTARPELDLWRWTVKVVNRALENDATGRPISILATSKREDDGLFTYSHAHLDHTSAAEDELERTVESKSATPFDGYLAITWTDTGAMAPAAAFFVEGVDVVSGQRCRYRMRGTKGRLGRGVSWDRSTFEAVFVVDPDGNFEITVPDGVAAAPAAALRFGNGVASTREPDPVPTATGVAGDAAVALDPVAAPEAAAVTAFAQPPVSSRLRFGTNASSGRQPAAPGAATGLDPDVAQGSGAAPAPEAVSIEPAVAAAEPGWHADPLGHHQSRYWDGAAWTGHVADDGHSGWDPIDG